MKKKETVMQKAQNVSRSFITFIIVFYSYFGYSQKKVFGRYYVDQGFSMFLSTSFEFYKKGTFMKENRGDLGTTDYGRGHYFIKNDTLILDYDLTKLVEQSYHRFKYYYSSNDSVEVKINVYDLNKKPLAGISVCSFLSDSIPYKGYNQDKITQKNGVAILKFKKQKHKISISVANDKYGWYFFNIFTNLNHEIAVYLKKSPNNPTAIFGSIDKYKILELKEDYLKLKAKDGRIITWKK